MDEIKKKFMKQENGATEVCMQGGMHPDIDGNFYVEIIKSVKEAVPDMHTHCFSPFEVLFGLLYLIFLSEFCVNAWKCWAWNVSWNSS